MKNIYSTILILIITMSCHAQVGRFSLDKLDYEKVESLMENQKFQEALNMLKDFPEDKVETKYLSAYCHFRLKEYKLSTILFAQVYKTRPSHRYTCLYYAQSIVSQIDLNSPINEVDVLRMQNAVGILSKGILLISTSMPKDMLARYVCNEKAISTAIRRV